jgi:hypothetical protein
MRVLFQQADLDTCLTALILGVTEADDISVVCGEADVRDLADPSVVCLEVGGAGQVDLNNYDHHQLGGPLDPACVQALARTGNLSQPMRRLVEYVDGVDRGRLGDLPLVKSDVMTLSAVFSGMRLSTPDPRAQFLNGLKMLRLILQRGYDPAGPIPELPEWREFFDRKRLESVAIKSMRNQIRTFMTRQNLRGGFVETDYIGALGLLYDEGFDVAIAYSPNYRSPSGGPTIAKYSIGRPAGRRVDGLLSRMNVRDPGWGGPAHGTIIGSPRAGTNLTPDEVIAIVEEEM